MADGLGAAVPSASNEENEMIEETLEAATYEEYVTRMEHEQDMERLQQQFNERAEKYRSSEETLEQTIITRLNTEFSKNDFVQKKKIIDMKRSTICAICPKYITARKLRRQR